MMKRFTTQGSPGCLFVVAFVLIMVFYGNGIAAELKFGNWQCIAETNSLTNKERKKIGTFAGDGISTLWLSDSNSGAQTLQLTLKSKNNIASEYFSYRVDSADTLTIRSAVKGCESTCLTETVPKEGGLIKTMKRGMRFKVEYDTVPDVVRKPVFSLKGFTRAYNWLISE
jgi:hypothetical protein